MVVNTSKSNELSTRLHWFRKFYEYSLDEVAQETRIDRSTLSRVERGLIEPSPQVVNALDYSFGEGEGQHLLQKVTFAQYIAEQGD